MRTIRFKEVVECVLCGSDVSPEDEPHFALDEHVALCFACAVGRGGVYDTLHRRWLELPHLAGLDGAPPHTRRRYSAAC